MPIEHCGCLVSSVLKFAGNLGALFIPHRSPLPYKICKMAWHDIMRGEPPSRRLTCIPPPQSRAVKTHCCWQKLWRTIHKWYPQWWEGGHLVREVLRIRSCTLSSRHWRTFCPCRLCCRKVRISAKTLYIIMCQAIVWQYPIVRVFVVSVSRVAMIQIRNPKSTELLKS